MAGEPAPRGRDGQARFRNQRLPFIDHPGGQPRPDPSVDPITARGCGSPPTPPRGSARRSSVRSPTRVAGPHPDPHRQRAQEARRCPAQAGGPGDRDPTIEEIAEPQSIWIEADVIMRAAQQLVWLDKPVGDDSDAAQFGDLIPDESTPSPYDAAGASLMRQRLTRCSSTSPTATAASSSCATPSTASKRRRWTTWPSCSGSRASAPAGIEESALRKLSTLAEAQALRDAA